MPRSTEPWTSWKAHCRHLGQNQSKGCALAETVRALLHSVAGDNPSCSPAAPRGHPSLSVILDPHPVFLDPHLVMLDLIQDPDPGLCEHSQDSPYTRRGAR